MKAGVTIHRPLRDGRMASVHSPDNISIELLQAGGRKESCAPRTEMPNIGHWYSKAPTSLRKPKRGKMQ